MSCLLAVMIPPVALLRLFDPAYDALDESMDYLLVDIADIAVASRMAAASAASERPFAGPWRLLDDSVQPEGLSGGEEGK